MALKSIIDIEINDQRFKHFADLFARYQASVKAMPEAWRRVNEAIDKSGKTVEEIEEALRAQVGTGGQRERQLQQELKVTQEIADRRRAMQDLETKWEAQAASVRDRQVIAWRSLVRHSKDFAGHIATATRWLLRWTAITGVVSGLLGAGGLFGIARLAGNAGNARRSSLGLGVSVGEQKAFDVNYGRVVNTQSFLTGVNEALHDITKRVGLLGAGLTEDQMRGKNTAQIADELIPALKKIADQTPESMMAQVLQARHLDQFVTLDEFQRLKNTPTAELDQYRAGFRRDQKSLGFTDAVAKAWQDLQVQLTRAGEQIEAVFVKGLVPLAPQLANLSNAIVKTIDQIMSSPQLKDWIDGLASGVKWLGDFLLSDRFKDSLNEMLKWAEDFGRTVGEFVQKVANFVGPVDDFGKNVKEIVRATASFVKAIDDVATILTRILRPFFTGETAMKRPPTKAEAEAPNSPFFNYKGPFADSPTDFNWQFDEKTNTWNRPPPDWFQRFKNRLFGTDAPRGVRNNNPLNLEFREGQGAVGSDGRFGVYGSMEEGVAAARRQLVDYQDRRGLDTIAKIINRWAPPSENDTAGYIKGVSERTRIGADEKIDVHNPKVAAALIAAMAKREIGRDLDPDVVNKGVAMSNSAPGVGPIGRSGGSNVNIYVHNNTGGNAIVSASQLAY